MFKRKTSTILDGRALREKLLPGLIERFNKLSSKPVLCIIQVGDRVDSTAFIRAKKSFAAKIGIEVKHVHVSETIPQNELIDIIKENNADSSVKGIVVQLPLPIGLDRDAVIDTVDHLKDVDALTAVSIKRWVEGVSLNKDEGGDVLMPATARGIKTLLKNYGIDLFGKKVAVIGRSTLVGKPIAMMCLNESATVSICHSKTPDLAEITKEADVLIVAAGKPGLIGPKHVHKKQVVIDVGINTVAGDKLDEEVEGTKLVGDVDFEKVKGKVAAITPVPGGVGPMTVFSLFENLLDLCEN